jgi:hypothetical protein
MSALAPGLGLCLGSLRDERRRQPDAAAARSSPRVVRSRPASAAKPAGVGDDEAAAPGRYRVRLSPEPATDRVDDFGRLLRYLIRGSDGVNVNLRLVAVGAAAPYFYAGRRGEYANGLETLAKLVQAKKLGLWRACPRTVYDRIAASRHAANSIGVWPY